MAIVKNGINGKFSGKVGSVIGYQLGDQNVIRTVGERRKPFSPLELLNQKKMKAEREVWEQSDLQLADGPVHVYAAFRDLLTENISDSVYCGVI